MNFISNCFPIFVKNCFSSFPTNVGNDEKQYDSKVDIFEDLRCISVQNNIFEIKSIEDLFKDDVINSIEKYLSDDSVPNTLKIKLRKDLKVIMDLKEKRFNRFSFANGCVFNSKNISFDNKLPKDVLLHFFPENLESQKYLESTIEVKTITSSDVIKKEDPLIGQQGVFSKRKIKKGECIGAFYGVFISDEKDKNKLYRLCELANVSSAKYSVTADPIGKFKSNDSMWQGTGSLAKINSGSKSFYQHTTPSNVRMQNIPVKINGVEYSVKFYFAKKNIKPGVELKY